MHIYRVGNRAFLGNDCIIPQGASLGDDMLIGLQTLAPKVVNAKETYLGNPSFKIKRALGEESHDKMTYNPPMHRQALRIGAEALGFLILNVTLAIKSSIFFIGVDWADESHLPTPAVWALIPLLMIAHTVIAFFVVYTIKWTVIGRIKAGTYPLYSPKIWGIELFERMEECALMVGK
jgi:hypothetical protein